MLDLLKALFFGDSTAAAQVGLDEVRLASAALLVEAAMTDGTMAEAERRHILTLLQERFAMSPEAAQRLFEQAAKRQEQEAQLFPFTRVIVERFDQRQRIELIGMLWEVAYADGRLHDYEASLVRQVAGLLYVSDQDSGRARQEALARLGISGETLD